MNHSPIRRRRLLALTASGLGLTLAGCAGGSNDTSGGEFGGWFANVSNYEGVVDETGADEVTVTVGATGNGGGYAFDPPAVKVSTGTTVVWEWTGAGGSHNVVDEGGAFESQLVADAGHTFEHTFEEAGTFKYKCVPHAAMGMKGVVVVA